MDVHPQCAPAAVKPAAPRALKESVEQDMHKHTGLSLVEDHRTARGLQQDVLKDLGRSVLGQGGYRALLYANMSLEDKNNTKPLSYWRPAGTRQEETHDHCSKRKL